MSSSFIGRTITVSEMKKYLASKGVSCAEGSSRNDIKKCVWETQVSELDPRDLEAFMTDNGIEFDRSSSTELKRSIAEAAYQNDEDSSSDLSSGLFVGENMSISQMKSFLAKQGCEHFWCIGKR